jgi:hypothetical protein
VFHQFLNDHRGLVDLLTFLCAGVAAISLAQLALTVSIIAGIASISLAGLRWHDRIRYGPRGKE